MNEVRRLGLWGFFFAASALGFALIDNDDMARTILTIAAVHFVGSSICKQIYNAQKGKV